jgi:nucleoside-diphosphate-sugar epimerase
VTGAPGWLGTRLVEVLRDGLPELPVSGPPRKIRCLVLPGTPETALRELGSDVELVEGDIRDSSTLSGFFRGAEGATVFHLAGVVRPRRPSDFHDVHVTGTRNLLRHAAASGVRRFLPISSNMVAGPNRHPERLFDERLRRAPDREALEALAHPVDVARERLAVALQASLAFPAAHVQPEIAVHVGE